jgi:hypothetical protein
MENSFEKIRNNSADIAMIISDANEFNTQNWINGMKINPQNLQSGVANFLKLLKDLNIDFVIVGGIAILSYVELRNTKDFDIIIDRHNYIKLKPFLEVLTEEGDFANCLTEEKLRVDLLFADNPIFRYVKYGFEQNLDYEQGNFPTATPEGLVMMKLYALADLTLQHQVFGKKEILTKILLYQSDVNILNAMYEIDFSKILRLLEKHLSESGFEIVKEFLESQRVI